MYVLGWIRMITRPFQQQQSNRKIVQYRAQGAYLNKGVESGSVPEGMFPELSGVDPRYLGGLRKWGSMKTVISLSDRLTDVLTTKGAIRKFRYVVFRKYGTGTVYRAYVVLFSTTTGSAAGVSVVYSEDGTTFTELVIHAAGTVARTANLDVVVADDRMLVLVEGMAPQIVYYTGIIRRRVREPLQTVERGARYLPVRPGHLGKIPRTISGGMENTRWHIGSTPA
jgi:hypothetical protein